MNVTKAIIERNLPLSQKYTLVSNNYISLIDGIGTCCDNCGKLIANMATVKGDDDLKSYTIGLDCLDTFLINNQLLDGESVEQVERVKKALPKIVKIVKEQREFLQKNPFIDTMTIEAPDYLPGYMVFEYYQMGKQRWNDGAKFKVMDFELLIKALQAANPHANIQFKRKN